MKLRERRGPSGATWSVSWTQWLDDECRNLPLQVGSAHQAQLTPHPPRVAKDLLQTPGTLPGGQPPLSPGKWPLTVAHTLTLGQTSVTGFGRGLVDEMWSWMTQRGPKPGQEGGRMHTRLEPHGLRQGTPGVPRSWRSTHL
ncbi:hypothetical protein H1C71_037635 [Ictidomys tridecemlineatus]|nr:hypothetical protein H1C71_037635 [Ictidomys tridecemlineatus]